MIRVSKLFAKVISRRQKKSQAINCAKMLILDYLTIFNLEEHMSPSSAIHFRNVIVSYIVWLLVVCKSPWFL